MGKKKGSRKKGSQAGDEDSSSIASASTLSSVAELGFDEGTAVDDDPFEIAVDALYEKRATTRERGLHKLVTLLAGSFAYEEALVRKETLSTLMLGCIKKGTVVEAALACRGIALLLVTLGAGEEAESLQQDAHPVFEQAACYGKATAVKAAAVDALAVTAFTASDDPGVIDKCMSGFANLWKTGSTRVATAAIRGWSLLLSTVPAWRMTTHSVEQSLQSLAKQLHSEDVEVRAAAGEAIALLYHSCGISDLDAFLENDQLAESPPASPVRQMQHSQSQVQSQAPLSSSPLSAQTFQLQNGSSDSLAPHAQDVSLPEVATDAAGHTSSSSTDIASQQAHVSTGPESACSHSADADSDLEASRLMQDSSEPRPAESPYSRACDDTIPLPHEHDESQVQEAAQQQAHDPQHAQQHFNDLRQADHYMQHSQAEATHTTTTNGNLASEQASPLPARTQDATAEAISSSQEQGMGKSGLVANPRSGAQNPQQKAEAISNGLDDVVGRMRQLATNRGDKSRRSKKDRVSMKSTFRELCNVVEQDGAVAPSKIKLRHGDTLIIDTLVGTVQLNALRRFLAEGFQTHLQQNPLMHQIFNFQPREERAERLTPLEKKLYRSPASAESKSRTQRRNHDRATTSAYKGAMMSED